MADWEPNEFQKRAMRLILNDAQATLDLQRHVKRLDPNTPEQLLPDVALENRINAVVGPIKKELEETKAELLKKKSVDMREYQWEQLRKMGWKDNQIQELEERMDKDKEDYLFGNYVAAAKYYQQMDQPALPKSSSRRDVGISGHPKSGETWREDFQSEDGKLRQMALAGDKSRRKRKAWAAEEAAKARAEFRANYRGAR